MTLETLSRRVAMDLNRFLKVEIHTVRFPDGRQIDDWAWLVMPDYAVMLVHTVDGRFLFFRQLKYAAPGPLLAPPGGYLNPDETPLDGAKRELLEETGHEAGTWHTLGSFAVDANRGAGTAHLFLAVDAVPSRMPVADDLDSQELLLLERHEVERMLDAGESGMLGWAAVASLGLRKLDALRALRG